MVMKTEIELSHYDCERLITALRHVSDGKEVDAQDSEILETLQSILVNRVCCKKCDEFLTKCICHR